jgi:LmbE family N-acetylglucosaminyl deacetylase
MPVERVLVVCAHTDDEALGCGATLRRHVQGGAEVFCISLTNGVGSRSDAHVGGKVAQRSEAAEESARVLGFRWIANGGFPDNALDTVPLLEIARFVEAAKGEAKPDIIYTHHGGDLNVDHRVAFAATLTAFRPQPDERYSEIRTFEVPSSTEWSHASLGPIFDPTLFVDAQETWAAKQAALVAYEMEMRAFPHARSTQAIDALSTWRGAQVGLTRAEAFEVVRRIVRGRKP